MSGKPHTNWAGRALRGYGSIEVVLDRVVLGGSAVAGTVGAVVLILGEIRAGWVAKVGVWAYGAGLVAMVVCSAGYHFTSRPRLKEWLRRWDHAAIFLMIAGTCSPFIALYGKGVWSIGPLAIVWLVAIAGVAVKLLLPRRFELASIIVYLAMGGILIVALGPVMHLLSPWTIVLLSLGAAIYVLGLAFHMWDDLPYQNVVWHLMVIAAAACHYAAIFITLRHLAQI